MAEAKQPSRPKKPRPTAERLVTENPALRVHERRLLTPRRKGSGPAASLTAMDVPRIKVAKTYGRVERNVNAGGDVGGAYAVAVPVDEHAKGDA